MWCLSYFNNKLMFKYHSTSEECTKSKFGAGQMETVTKYSFSESIHNKRGISDDFLVIVI